ncbi:phosphatidylserine decarboxylase [Candidatus Woesearchaeota archaeon]|jgi:phosphatidylserine decarboxylase|nr:phosphatidylserine decarboxylase [Candidatus Woesearchaeota archaeon]
MFATISNAVVFILVIIILLLAIFFLFYQFWFLRKPKRRIPKGNCIVSPANGRIARILDISNVKKANISKGLLGKVNILTKDTVKKGYLIVIVMTPFNVHYQRSPVDGTVLKTRYRKGSFINVVKDASSLQSLQNEKNEIIIKNRKLGKIKVVQVAGFLARRISCFVKKNQKIHKGEELGLISLGSQVLLVLPKLKLQVKEGQKVIDGETIIARFRQ